MKTKTIDRTQVELKITRELDKPGELYIVTTPDATSEYSKRSHDGFGSSREEALKRWMKYHEDKQFMVLDEDVCHRHFDKNIHMGCGNHTQLMVKLLHDKLDKALSTLSGMQQNGGMGTEFLHKEDEEGCNIISTILADICTALHRTPLPRD
jgi:hypothetical protein